MPPLRAPFAAMTILLLVGPVLAQTPGQRIILEQSGASPRQEGFVRVQSSVNFFVPGPAGDGEEAQRLREHARRSVYEMAAHECDLLREVLAKDCRLESVTSNITRQQYGQQQEGFSVNGSMNFQITVK